MASHSSFVLHHSRDGWALTGGEFVIEQLAVYGSCHGSGGVERDQKMEMRSEVMYVGDPLVFCYRVRADMARAESAA